MNTSASAVSGKQRDPTCQGYFTAGRLFSVTCGDHTSFADSTHQCIELFVMHTAHTDANTRVRGKHEIYKVFTQTVQSYSTHTALMHTHR